jgi:hypothetical protein
MKNEKIIEFIEFVQNNKTLKKLKVDIFHDIQKTGWFGTSPFYHRFFSLFEVMRKHYINDHVGAGSVLSLSTSDMKDFCQFYVDEYFVFEKELKTLLACEKLLGKILK